jgi:hypothetical protein
VFRRRPPPSERDEDLTAILTWLMRLDEKLDRIELPVRGEDPDDQ